MNDISKEILEKYQIRKTKQQKTEFIEFMKSKFPELKVESGGFAKNRNLVIGDVDSAKAVLGAHYDTCAVMPFPNFIMPKSILISFFYGFLTALPMLAICIFGAKLVEYFTDSFILMETTYFALLVLCLGAMFAGKPNRHTVNDNTSGVITLCEMLCMLSEEERRDLAFVFFDNEENGLLGSSWFAKQHKEAMKDKLLLNFDCVSDGDYIMLLPNKEAKKDLLPALTEAFEHAEDKTVLIETKHVYYPSDQANFKKNIGVAAFKRCFLGLYLDKIHTPKDTVMDERNIELICEGTRKFLEKL